MAGKCSTRGTLSPSQAGKEMPAMPQSGHKASQAGQGCRRVPPTQRGTPQQEHSAQRAGRERLCPAGSAAGERAPQKTALPAENRVCHKQTALPAFSRVCYEQTELPSSSAHRDRNRERKGSALLLSLSPAASPGSRARHCAISPTLLYLGIHLSARHPSHLSSSCLRITSSADSWSPVPLHGHTQKCRSGEELVCSFFPCENSEEKNN